MGGQGNDIGGRLGKGNQRVARAMGLRRSRPASRRRTGCRLAGPPKGLIQVGARQSAARITSETTTGEVQIELVLGLLE